MIEEQPQGFAFQSSGFPRCSSADIGGKPAGKGGFSTACGRLESMSWTRAELLRPPLYGW